MAAAGPAPVYIALIDLSRAANTTAAGDDSSSSESEEFLEQVKSSLLAAVEVLPACALFGIITFSRQVCERVVG